MKLRVGLILTTMVLGVMLLSGMVLAKTLIGGPGNNNYMGTKGTDKIFGGGGADDLGGKEDRDYIYGEKGGDRLHGGRGNDDLDGGPGADTAWGDEGKDDLKAAETKIQGSIQVAQVKGGRKLDRLLGGRGNDTIRADNGKRDIIRGGPGRDKAYVDPVDKVKGVEVVPGGANKPPVANNDKLTIDFNTVGNGNVLTNDTDADNPNNTNAGLTVKDTDSTTPGVQPESGPTHGQLTLNANGSYTYTPAHNYYGPDSFTYKATDGAADSNVAGVEIFVKD
jgi:Ca2+-binding RTX toxin-like protein